jgi:DMSO/TMAO reductase YedYZ molybdopterin-dependent catalytic subunit
LTCVSNEVGGILMGNARWLGIPLMDLLEDAGIDPKATQIVGRSVDDWSAGFPVAALKRGSKAIVALGMNGEPLPFDHGYPARLVVPGIYGYASATKWLDTIEVTTLEAAEGYWVPRGYAKEAPIKMGSRIDVPRGLTTVAPGLVAVAGIAWSQTVGISRVEVKIDNGEWQEAQLADEVDVDTWRQWKFAWQATTGQHEITVRTFDKNSKLQIEDRVAPLPNGATGWHQVLVFVS